MIQVNNLKKTYNKHTKSAMTVLNEVSLTLPDTGFVCILGESGCGKTTLMNVMGGMDTFDGGTITVGEVSAKKYGTKLMEEERNRQFGYIFQNYYMLSERSVAYNVYLGLHSLPISRIEKLKRVKEALDAVGMLAYAKKRTSDLSGGQQQRVAIARALARQPKIIFADEPTGNLDEANTNQVCAILRQISKDCLVVMVTHEKRIAHQFADRIISLDAGKVVQDVANEPLSLAENMPELKMKAVAPDKKKSNHWNFRNLWNEAMQMLAAKGHRTGWLYVCLMVLTAVIILTVGDYLTAASIRPEEFVLTDSRVLEINVSRNTVENVDLNQTFLDYLDYLKDSGLDITFLPLVTSQASYHFNSPFAQIGELSENVSGFSYLPLEMLDEEALIYGRMPESPEEIVLDRYVAEKFMNGNGILLGSLEDVSGLIGQTLTLSKKQITLKIVGICETSNMTIYMDKYAMITCASAGNSVMSLSQLKEMFPGKYDDVVLGEGEVYAGKNAGAFIYRVGSYAGMNNNWNCLVTGLVEEDIYASYVMRDEDYDAFIRDMIATTRQFLIYSEDKEAVKYFVTSELPNEFKYTIQVDVEDLYADYMTVYQNAVAEKTGTRTIVTVTIMAVAAIMLLFLLRARTQERLEFFTVYRLLGVPKRKTVAILFLENGFLSLISSLPAALITYGVITALNLLPSLEFSMVLPFSAAAVSYAAVFVFHMIFALLPAMRMLKYPPAQLAAKYDF